MSGHRLELAEQCLRLLQSWWCKDRVRISRAAGQLLQLREGERILLRDEVWKVCHCRTVNNAQVEISEDSSVAVEYGLKLESSDSSGSVSALLIVPIDKNHPMIEFISLDHHSVCEILPEEIYTLGAC